VKVIEHHHHHLVHAKHPVGLGRCGARAHNVGPRVRYSAHAHAAQGLQKRGCCVVVEAIALLKEFVQQHAHLPNFQIDPGLRPRQQRLAGLGGRRKEPDPPRLRRIRPPIRQQAAVYESGIQTL